MKLKITNEQLVRLATLLDTLDTKTVQLPVKPLYALSKLELEVGKLEKARAQAHKALLERHGVFDERGRLAVEQGQYVLKDARLFDAEFSELQEMEVALEVMTEHLSADKVIADNTSYNLARILTLLESLPRE